MNKPKVSVVLSSYNCPDSLREILVSLKNQTFKDFEVIVIDDCSKTGDDYEVAKQYADVVIKNEKNLGVAKSYNKGMRIAKADIIVTTASDCVVDEKWVETIVLTFEKDKDIKVLMGNTKVPKSTFIGNCISALGLPAGGSIGFDKIWEVDKNSYTERMSGCNWAIKKEVLEKIGYWDETFPYAGGEDGEYAFRLRDNKIKIKYIPEMIVYHKPRTNFKSFIKWHYTRGKGYYYFIKRVGNFGGFFKNKIWSTKNIFLYSLFSTRIFLVVPLHFLSFFLQQLGYISEASKRTTSYSLINKFYKRPLGLQVEVTNRCNLRCKICEHSYSKNKGEDMSLDLFKKIEGKYLVMNFTGAGENLINRDFLEILKLARKKAFFITFADNFTLMDEEIIKKLIKLKINRIYASVDGATKETFESIRVGAKFEEVINNIKNFINIKRELKKSKPELVVRFVPNKKNIYEMPLMTKLVKELGLKKLHISKLYTSNSTSDLKLTEQDYKKYKEETLKLSKELKVDVRFDEKRGPLSKCRSMLSFVICANGDIVPCCFVIQRFPYKEVIKKFSFGNLKNAKGVKDIWNNNGYIKFRQNLNWEFSPEMCIGCENRLEK